MPERLANESDCNRETAEKSEPRKNLHESHKGKRKNTTYLDEHT